MTSLKKNNNQTSLYFKRYQYKVTFKANKHFLNNVGKDVHDMYR